MPDFSNFNPQPKKGKKPKATKKPIAKRSKKHKTITKASKQHILLVKSMPCILTGACGNTEAHHISSSYKRLGKKEGQEHYYAIPLNYEYHRGHSGIHTLGRKEWERRFNTTEEQLLEKFWKIIKFDKGILL